MGCVAWCGEKYDSKDSGCEPRRSVSERDGEVV